MLTRDTALINNQILLESRFYDGTLLTDVSQITRVEIWKKNPAQNDSVLVQTIETAQVIHSSTGVYQYVVEPVLYADVYYDKVWFIPAVGATEESIVNSFTVNSLQGVSSLGLVTSRLYGTIVDARGEPIQNVIVRIDKLDQSVSTGALVVFKPIVTYTNQAGEFSVYVVTDTRFSVSIPAIGYRRIFKIPAGTQSKNIKDVDPFLYPPVENPGEINNYLGTAENDLLRPSSTGYATNFQEEVNTPIFDWDQR